MIADKTFEITGTERVFSSDIRIKGKTYVRVFLDVLGTLPTVWEIMDVSLYTIINDNIVFNDAPTGVKLNLQVSTTPSELTTVPTDSAILVNMKGEVVTVAGMKAEILSLYADKNTIDSVASNLPVINKTEEYTATTQANVVKTQDNVDTSQANVVKTQANVNTTQDNVDTTQDNVDTTQANVVITQANVTTTHAYVVKTQDNVNITQTHKASIETLKAEIESMKSSVDATKDSVLAKDTFSESIEYYYSSLTLAKKAEFIKEYMDVILGDIIDNGTVYSLEIVNDTNTILGAEVDALL